MPNAARSTLDRETDARFWAQTGYKVGRRLDPADPADQQMVPVWLDVHGKVADEDARGELHLTYNHPAVESALSDAEIASHAQAGHLAAAAVTEDPTQVWDHLHAATQAGEVHADATRRAADVQPPTVSPFLADLVAAWAAARSGQPHDPIDRRLPADHPARTAEGPGGVDHPTPVPPWASPPPSPTDAPPGSTAQVPAPPPVTTPVSPAHQAAQDHLALEQARAAPDHAAQVHHRARRHHRHHRRGAAAGPPGHAGRTVPPQAVSRVREAAAGIAARHPGTYVGTVYAQGSWQVQAAGSRPELDGWYTQVSDHPDQFLYAAAWDRGSPQWPAPVGEVFGSSRGVLAEVGQGTQGDRDPATAGPAPGAGTDRDPAAPERLQAEPAKIRIAVSPVVVAVGALLVGGALLAYSHSGGAQRRA